MIRDSSSKTFITPVWILAVAALLKTALLVVSIVSIKTYLQRNGHEMKVPYYTLDWCIIALAITQAVVYWVLRRKIYARKWAMAHVLLMLFVLVFIPVLYSLAIFLLSTHGGLDTNTETMSKANTLKFYIFWLSLITASVFFTAAMMKTYWLKDQYLHDEIDAIGTAD